MTARPFLIVDPGEVRTRRVGYCLILLVLVAAAAGSVLWFRADRGTGTAQQALIGAITALCCFFLALFLLRTRRFWVPDPIFRMNSEGIRLRGSLTGRADVEIPWAEITGIGVWRAGADDRVDVDSPVIARIIAFDRDHNDVPAAAGRRTWYLRPLPHHTMIVVSIGPRSPTQARLFAAELAAVRAATAAAHRRRQHTAAAELAVLTAELERWQEDWSAEAQPAGFFVVAADELTDRPALSAAARAFGRETVELADVPPARLDSPHDAARLLRHAATELEPYL